MTDINEDDLWFVQFEGGAVRAFTLEQLDEAFQAGTIDEGTLVRLDGSLDWKPLGEVLAGAAEAPSSEAAPAAFASSAPSIPTNDVAPISAPPPPVELASLDLDDRASFGASKKRAAIFGVLAAVVVLGGVAFTAVRVSSSPAGDPSKVTASMPAAPAPKAAEPTPEGAADAGPRFNEDQRRLLLEADKKREAEAAARRPARSERTGPSKPIKIGDPIKKGGNKYDPLNGAL